jgi:thiol-disulfide isomerase/thioredoxin
MKRAVAAILLLVAAAAARGSTENGALPPHLDDRGRAAYLDYLGATGHRAFVIAPGGTWAWKGDEGTAHRALESALDECRQASSQRCVPFSVDGRVVFDTSVWKTLWGPYLVRDAALRASTGFRRGQRFYDLGLRSPENRPMKLSDLRGSVVILHFWGSWCQACRHEMPELQQLERQLGRKAGVRLVMVQAREPIAQSRRWVRAQKLNLALYDSGAADNRDEHFTLADGKSIHDREIAFAFPTTYVLDRHGIVVFSHSGPISGWSGYLPFLRDAAGSPRT